MTPEQNDIWEFLQLQGGARGTQSPSDTNYITDGNGNALVDEDGNNIVWQ